MSSSAKTWHPDNAKWLWISIVVLIIDQLSKWSVREHLTPYVPVKLLPWLNLQVAYNRGAAFSLLNSQPGWARWALGMVAIIIIGYLLIWIFQSESYKKFLLLALTLILGGAASNLVDRIWFGYVTDFIDFHINTWHFATFNLADAAISIGAVLLALLLLLKRD